MVAGIAGVLMAAAVLAFALPVIAVLPIFFDSNIPKSTKYSVIISYWVTVALFVFVGGWIVLLNDIF